ncbi:hypothetical protein PanWU01x14_154740 [Parasponia andersonii]|uniref:Uncharacterized protein n=1 Tax=Parasponia andersonii TaxID=3476 RepID=A0A2P5CGH6_PARAD|nr:hypothetical protein PanWU01x14_154740 [Parasponia andersonii]
MCNEYKTKPFLDFVNSFLQGPPNQGEETRIKCQTKDTALVLDESGLRYTVKTSVSASDRLIMILPIFFFVFSPLLQELYWYPQGSGHTTPGSNSVNKHLPA